MDITPKLGVNHVISCVVVFCCVFFIFFYALITIYLINKIIANINFAGIPKKGLSKALFVYLTAKLNK